MKYLESKVFNLRLAVEPEEWHINYYARVIN